MQVRSSPRQVLSSPNGRPIHEFSLHNCLNSPTTKPLDIRLLSARRLSATIYNPSHIRAYRNLPASGCLTIPYDIEAVLLDTICA